MSGFQKFIGNYHSHRKTKKFGELRQQIEELLRAEVVNYQKVHDLDHQIALIRDIIAQNKGSDSNNESENELVELDKIYNDNSFDDKEDTLSTSDSFFCR